MVSHHHISRIFDAFSVENDEYFLIRIRIGALRVYEGAARVSSDLSRYLIRWRLLKLTFHFFLHSTFSLLNQIQGYRRITPTLFLDLYMNLGMISRGKKRIRSGSIMTMMRAMNIGTRMIPTSLRASETLIPAMWQSI